MPSRAKERESQQGPCRSRSLCALVTCRGSPLATASQPQEGERFHRRPTRSVCDQRGRPHCGAEQCIREAAHLRKYSARSRPVPHSDELRLTTDGGAPSHVGLIGPQMWRSGLYMDAFFWAILAETKRSDLPGTLVFRGRGARCPVIQK